MQPKELAKQLGISHQFCNRLKKRGMPTASLEAALQWRERYLDITQTKKWRIDGNSGKKTGIDAKEEAMSDALIKNSLTEALTHIVPSIYFSQVGWLGGALRDHGVKVTAEQLMKVQAILFYAYMDEVDDFLQTENQCKLPDALMAQ